MNITKSQQARLNFLQTDLQHCNILKTLDSDVFVKFEVSELGSNLEGDKSSDYLVVKAVTNSPDHETQNSLAKHYLEKRWLIFISPRGKMFAPMFPDYLEGKKKTYCGRITLSNIVW